MIRVRALAVQDAGAAIALRREALTAEPLAFGSSLEDDPGLTLPAMRGSLARRDGFALLGAFEESELVGMVGLLRLERVKLRHRALIWGMYVRPAARRRGAGDALLRAAVERARAWPGVTRVELSVFETAPEARRLYQRAGFREWGVEPRAIVWGGREVAEHHMVLDLVGLPLPEEPRG
jgi:RimJ/RimL family protein N-acetyltransferase